MKRPENKKNKVLIICLAFFAKQQAGLVKGNFRLILQTMPLNRQYSSNLFLSRPVFFGTTFAGSLRLGGMWTFHFSLIMFALIILIIWDISPALKLIDFYFGDIIGMTSLILCSWFDYTFEDHHGEGGW